MTTTLMTGYMFAEVRKRSDGSFYLDVGPGPFTSEGGILSIVVSNPTEDPVLVGVADVLSIGSVQVHLIQLATSLPNPAFVQINPGATFTFVLSGGQTVDETQRCSFNLVVCPAPVQSTLQRTAEQVDPWHG